MTRSLLVRALVVAGVTIPLAACGGDDGSETASDEAPTAVPAVAYVEDLCTSVTGYRSDLDARGEALQEELAELGTDVAAAQDALVALLEDAAAATQTLAEDVRALGTPDVEGGDEVAVGFVNALERAEDLFATAAEEVAALPDDDPDALGEGLTTVGENLDSASGELEATFQELESGELSEAAADVEACAEVMS